jgi:hypothetical protein
MGVIACVTPDVFNRKSAFRRLGFLSRLLPFSFDYSKDAVNEILSFIGTLEESKLRTETLKIRTKRKTEIIIPQHYLNLLTIKSRILAETIDDFCPYKCPDEQRLIGARAKKMLTCYLKSICLTNGCATVNEDCWHEFEAMFYYFNYDMREVP